MNIQAETLEQWARDGVEVILTLRERDSRKRYTHRCKIKSVQRIGAAAFIAPFFDGLGYVVLPGHTERGLVPQIIGGHSALTAKLTVHDTCEYCNFARRDDSLGVCEAHAAALGLKPDQIKWDAK